MQIDVNLTYIFIFLIICLAIFLFHNGFGIRLFVKKDEKITEKFLDKFPLVSPDFMNKSNKEQSIENNQEIHELNKRVENLEEYVQALNTKIEKQLDMILKELGKRG